MASMTLSAPTAPTFTSAAGVQEFGTDEAAEKTLSELLNNSRLVILTGSGTSRDLTGRSKVAPMMSDLFDQVKALASYQDLVADHPHLRAETNVEVLLSKAQAIAALGVSGTRAEPFIAEASTTIRESCDFIDETTDLGAHQTLLRKAVARTAGRDRLSLFTTNYDRAFEVAADKVRIAAIDGFGYGGNSRFAGAHFQHDLVSRGSRGELQLANEVIRLFKLHGSVDWDERSDGVYRVPEPANPVLIYPSTHKYQQSYRQPFLEAMSHYQAALRSSETSLLVAGYGFNDSHLNQPIIDALTGDATFKLVVVAPDAVTSIHPTLQSLRDSIDAGDQRIGLLSGTFADLATYFPAPPTRDPWQETRDALEAIWGAK